MHAHAVTLSAEAALIIFVSLPSADEEGNSRLSKRHIHAVPRPSILAYLSSKDVSVSVVVPIIIIALIVDMTFSTFSDILKEQSASIWGLLLFIAIILAIYGAGQYFLFRFLKQWGREIRSRESYLDKLYGLLRTAQYVIAAILAHHFSDSPDFSLLYSIYNSRNNT